jgi:formylglycine-generating enzyme required for sulfatase activity
MSRPFVPCFLLLAAFAAWSPSAAPPRRAPADATKGPAGELTNSVGMKLVRIDPGKFVMGSPRTEALRYDDEDAHEVEITRGFLLGAYEVTQEEYRKVTGATPAWFHPLGKGRDRLKGADPRRLPVEMVSWHDAVAFCRKLSELPAEKKAGRVYRLPSEAEWEHACRAGSTSVEPDVGFQFGATLSSREANFNGNFPYGKAPKGLYRACTTTVGTFAASRLGVYDMHGNVWEWCADWYDAEYYRVSPPRDPMGPAKGDFKVLRGGSWFHAGHVCRAAKRGWAGPDTRTKYVGFRVACSLLNAK